MQKNRKYEIGYVTSDKMDKTVVVSIMLSSLSPIVHSLAGTRQGDNRFYFPKEMLAETGLFSEKNQTFMHYIKNDQFTYGE